MLTRLLCALLTVSIAVTSLPPPAEAQFGIRRAFKSVVRAPAHILPRAAIIGAPLVVFGGPFRGVFGVVAAVAIGAVIYNHLTKTERREVSRRAKVVVAKDPEQKVTDTYTSNDGKRQVTIVAEPTQKASDLKNDPAILVASDKVVAPDAKSGKTEGAPPPANVASNDVPPGNGPVSDAPPASVTPASDPNKATVPTEKTAKPAAKPVVDEEVVRISEIPPDTQCRRVTTELELRKKKGQETADEKNSNTAIFCQTAPGEWKPAAA